jgi:DNA-binding CsgD family transcriptional regulator
MIGEAAVPLTATERSLGVPPGPPQLFGREREIAQIAESLGHIGTQGSALLVRGEAGIGKSRLLDEAKVLAAERGTHVLSTAGAPFETPMPFAGLHRLLRPTPEEIAALPQGQRDGLSVALGNSDGPPPDIFLVALATLNLLTERTDAAPLLIVVEDAHWLDAATSDVLAFIARRVEMERIVVLFAVRDGVVSHLDEAGLPEMRLTALDVASVSALLDAHAPELTQDARRRLVDEAGGNPLALVEFAHAAEPGRFDVLPRMVPLPIADRLERAFVGRVSTMSAVTRSVLLVAASDEGADLGQVLAAASNLTDRPATVADIAPAEGAGLVFVNGQALRFRHPLVRAAIYQSAGIPERQAVHHALAETHAEDPDRNVWHRAAALAGPNAEVAADLEAAAARALQKGAPAAAAIALRRSAELTAPDAGRGRLLVHAAELEFELGHSEVALALLAEAKPMPLEDSEHTRVMFLLEAADQDSWSGAARVAAFAEIASRHPGPDGSALALKSLLTVATSCWWGNPVQQTRDVVVAATRRLDVPDSDPAALAVLANADPIQCGSLVIDRISGITPDRASDPAALYLIGNAANAVWAFDLALGFLSAAVDGLRAQGRLGLLAQALTTYSWTAMHLAKETLALSAADEGARLARETGQTRWALSADLARATVAGERGDTATLEAVTHGAEAQLLPVGAHGMLSLVQFARGRCAVAHQLYADGYEHMKRIVDPDDVAYHPFVGSWALSDLVEAAAYSGRTEDAELHLSQLESLSAKTQGPFLRATLAYARPLLAADEDAEQLYLAALSAGLSNWPCYRGRLLLNYGRWLRRQHRVGESRGPLRAARENFDALAFGGLAETARRELRASGESSNSRVADARDQLTPQELQIASLAATGLSNREIGEQLYLSHRTVGSHLYRIFPKLGIASRAELRSVLPDAALSPA